MTGWPRLNNLLFAGLKTVGTLVYSHICSLLLLLPGLFISINLIIALASLLTAMVRLYRLVDLTKCGEIVSTVGLTAVRFRGLKGPLLVDGRACCGMVEDMQRVGFTVARLCRQPD